VTGADVLIGQIPAALVVFLAFLMVSVFVPVLGAVCLIRFGAATAEAA
jgi:hypothetical protein